MTREADLLHTMAIGRMHTWSALESGNRHMKRQLRLASRRDQMARLHHAQWLAK